MIDPRQEKGDKYADYFTTGELSKVIGRSIRTIQLWEEKGYIDPPKVRSPRGWRLYSPGEVAEIKKRAKKIRVGRYRSDRHPSTWWEKDKLKKANKQEKGKGK